MVLSGCESFAKAREERLRKEAEASARQQDPKTEQAPEVSSAEALACEQRGYFVARYKRNSAKGTWELSCDERKIEVSGGSAKRKVSKTNYLGVREGGLPWPVSPEEGTLECFPMDGMAMLFFVVDGKRYALNGTAMGCDRDDVPSACPSRAYNFESIWLDDPKQPGLKILNSLLDEAKGLCSKVR